MNFGEAEKFLLRRSFSKNNYVNSAGEQIIPDEILNRKKEAFSDGVSCQGRSLYVILQEAIANKLNQTVPRNKIYEPNIASEKTYYKMLFEDAFGKCGHVLPYFWMPKYTDATDPSARTLTFYSD
jgi:asparagine synthase (glutamine-hydrolysing)